MSRRRGSMPWSRWCTVEAWRQLAASCLLIVAAGCAVTRPPGPAGCGAYIDPLDASFASAVRGGATPAFGAQVMPQPQSRFVQSLERTLNAVKTRGKSALNVLILSGGGQWGAFGAGFLTGWSEADRRGVSKVMRDGIDIVTGVSTGALMATYAFLGTARDAELTASYLGTGPEGKGGLRADPISDEDIFERLGILRTVFSNAATDPRGRLDALVAEAVSGTIDAVAASGDDRQVFVGAVDLEDGGFKIFNLKPLAADAARARQENRTADRAALEACYGEMLLASAAVPYLFPPRFMDGRAYVDGGARFGAFLRSVDALATAEPERTFTEKNIFVIVNGDLRVAPVDKVKNNVLGIAQRSVSAIIDQIYKDSIFRIEMEAGGGGRSAPWKTHYVYVEDTACRDAHLEQTADKEHDFNPGFMKCVYDVGRTLGERQAWKSFAGVPHRVR